MVGTHQCAKSSDLERACQKTRDTKNQPYVEHQESESHDVKRHRMKPGEQIFNPIERGAQRPVNGGKGSYVRNDELVKRQYPGPIHVHQIVVVERQP